ncbi:MAG: EAL domain-containing protein [Pseudomonadota bacterium]
MALIGLTGSEPTILWCNAAMGQLCKSTSQSLEGTRADSLWPEMRAHIEIPALVATLRAGRGMERRSNPTSENRQVWRFVPIADEGDEVSQAAVYCRPVNASDATVAVELSADVKRELDRLSLVASSVTDGVAILDHRGRIEWANPAYLKRTEVTMEEVIGRTPEEVRPAERGPDGALLTPVSRLELDPSSPPERAFRSSDGTIYWIELHVAPLIDNQEGTRKTVVIGRDVTRRREFEDRLLEERERAEAAEKRLWTAIEAVPIAFALYDADDRLIAHNKLHYHFYDRSRDLIRPGVTFRETLEFGLRNGQYPDALGREDAWLEERLAKFHEAECDFEQELADGRWLRIIESRTKFGDTVAFRFDITEIKDHERRMEDYTNALEHTNLELAEQSAALELSESTVRYTALHDALTGLANRRYLDEELREAVKNDKRPIALLHLDLDRFKQINDTLGHAAGDAVLVAVAERIRANIREDDFAARIGGDEFVVLCRTNAGRDVLAGIAERLVKAMQQPVPFERNSCLFGASIGIAVCSATGPQVSDLLVQADVALYRAKNLGRNRYEFFSDELHAEIVARKTLSDELVAGIKKNEFVPFYQPQICLLTGKLVGAEALARWQRADGKFIAPDEFIRVAAELDLVAALDRQLLGRAVADWHEWRAQGLDLPRVAVNVSARRLADPTLLEDLDQLNIDPGMLVFELLESTYLDKADNQTNWTLDALRERGVAIELDDFGSGYASILSLFNLKPDAIKIDRELVSPIIQNENALSLIRSLVEIGRTLGVRVLAEGVESERHVELLREVGCNFAQGHLFSAPISAEAFTPFLQRMAVEGAGAALLPKNQTG